VQTSSLSSAGSYLYTPAHEESNSPVYDVRYSGQLGAQPKDPNALLQLERYHRLKRGQARQLVSITFYLQLDDTLSDPYPDGTATVSRPSSNTATHSLDDPAQPLP
jgi:hypothetical protein